MGYQFEVRYNAVELYMAGEKRYCERDSTYHHLLTFPAVECFAASDKCEGESECLSFDQHMQVASDMWQRHSNLTSTVAHPTVVFTTESKNMVKEQQAFVAENGEQKYPFNFDFVTNTQDATPDSGFMNDIGACC